MLDLPDRGRTEPWTSHSVPSHTHSLAQYNLVIPVSAWMPQALQVATSGGPETRQNSSMHNFRPNAQPSPSPKTGLQAEYEKEDKKLGLGCWWWRYCMTWICARMQCNVTDDPSSLVPLDRCRGIDLLVLCMGSWLDWRYELLRRRL